MKEGIAYIFGHEHEDIFVSKDSFERIDIDKLKPSYHFKEAKNTPPCYQLTRLNESFALISASYYCGYDWLEYGKSVIGIKPKAIVDHKFIDINQMLLSILSDSKMAQYCTELYEIKVNDPLIEIESSNDRITPIVVIHFLSLLEEIVNRGLKKSFYSQEEILTGSVKGKIHVSKSIKHQIAKQRLLDNHCRFNEFGINSIENRVLKKALEFALGFLKTYDYSYSFNTKALLAAFEHVDSQLSTNEISSCNTRSFYKSYDQALSIAQLILKKLSINITVGQTCPDRCCIPPYWINMSMLFELYVFSLLRKEYGHRVLYHFSTRGNELDFLLNTSESPMVIDAKYKPSYNKKEGAPTSDMRQIAGYSRLNRVYDRLKVADHRLLDCLIVYPQLDGVSDFKDFSSNMSEIIEYRGIYKLGIETPFR